MVIGSVVFGSILLVALVFAAASLYALMAVAVARRTREIGIRIALGATPRHVLGSVFARAGRQLGGGIIAGNSLILLLAWRADSLTADLLVIVGDHVRHHGGGGRAGVRRTGAPSAACSTDRGAATGVTCFWGRQWRIAKFVRGSSAPRFVRLGVNPVRAGVRPSRCSCLRGAFVGPRGLSVSVADDGARWLLLTP